MKNEMRAFRELLRNRNFTLYISSFYVNSFGGHMTLFAVWSQVTLLTNNSPTALGLATLLNVLPGILFAPWAGLLADRISKRTILILCYLSSSLIVALLFLSDSLWQLYTLATVLSMISAFTTPPHRSMLPLLVNPDQYVTMNSFMATVNNFLQFFRPALAGFVVSAFGYKMGFAIDFFTYFLPAAVLFVIRFHDQAAERNKSELQKTGMWQELHEGMSYIRTEPILVYLFTFLMLMTLAMGMQGPLTMIFVGQHLAPVKIASQYTGFLFSALGVGGILGAVLTPRLIQKVSVLWLLFASLAFDGLMVIIFSQSRTMWLALTCFALFGIITSVNQIVQDTLIQKIVPEHLRGRVYGAFGPITGPISLLSIGAGTSLAGVIGTRAVFFIAGLIEIAAVVICRLLPMYQGVRLSLAARFGKQAEVEM